MVDTPAWQNASVRWPEHSIAMLPTWVVVLSAIELVGFLALALGIATAAPEAAFMRANGEFQKPL